MVPNRISRRHEPTFTDSVRIQLLENDMDDLDIRLDREREEWRREKQELKDEIKEAKEEAGKIKWWMIGNFGALALGVLGLAIQMMVR